MSFTPSDKKKVLEAVLCIQQILRAVREGTGGGLVAADQRERAGLAVPHADALAVCLGGIPVEEGSLIGWDAQGKLTLDVETNPFALRQVAEWRTVTRQLIAALEAGVAASRAPGAGSRHAAFSAHVRPMLDACTAYGTHLPAVEVVVTYWFREAVGGSGYCQEGA